MKKRNIARIVGIALLAVLAAGLLAGCAAPSDKKADLTGMWRQKSGVFTDRVRDTYEDCCLEFLAGGEYVLYTPEGDGYEELDRAGYQIRDGKLVFGIAADAPECAFTVNAKELTIITETGAAVFDRMEENAKK